MLIQGIGYYREVEGKTVPEVKGKGGTYQNRETKESTEREEKGKGGKRRGRGRGRGCAAKD